ncbi:hypothetical protein MGYG_01850 [Nannizzia gypsea CBS 118893]|uniref:Uncharacterized protein n=1 Tax=Arthroderma gypseum (strain ATCC MYA-4604 / CBS 118893) TaxID=535722 RepID=E5R3Y9_ARTGP|nr:hypothetical protein MGYG_01850 [Nannizzia gypsea CBS 118893]EFQ98835.1 hypothetical protein MGYG_01850 [Nannizzia gypsea CBS 118893]
MSVMNKREREEGKEEKGGRGAGEGRVDKGIFWKANMALEQRRLPTAPTKHRGRANEPCADAYWPQPLEVCLIETASSRPSCLSCWSNCSALGKHSWRRISSRHIFTLLTAGWLAVCVWKEQAGATAEQEGKVSVREKRSCKGDFLGCSETRIGRISLCKNMFLHRHPLSIRAASHSSRRPANNITKDHRPPRVPRLKCGFAFSYRGVPVLEAIFVSYVEDKRLFWLSLAVSLALGASSWRWRFGTRGQRPETEKIMNQAGEQGPQPRNRAP